MFRSAAELAAALAERIANTIRQQPDLVLELPAGGTPVLTYARLCSLHAAGAFDASRLTTFNLDEFVGVCAGAPGSFRAFMDEHLSGPLRLRAEQIHFLAGAAADLEAECGRYEAAIERAGGTDLQLLGLGTNGHIGFNEPGLSLQARTHGVALAESTRRDNVGLCGGDAVRVSREALSMGMGTILKAARLMLVATGERKAWILEQAVRGPVTTQVPASFLQLHRAVELLLDESAASRLTVERQG